MNKMTRKVLTGFGTLIGPAFALLLAVTVPALAINAQAQEPPSPAIDSEAPVTTSDDNAPDASEVEVRSLTGPLQLLINPVYPPEQARQVFQPLIDYLNAVTDLEIELSVARNFHRYWLDARSGKTPALIFEEPHMTAWRMQQFDYQPLVTTSAPMSFSLLTSGALADSPMNGFIGRRVSSLPSPSLGYLVMASWFENPMQQPLIQSTATSWLDAVEMIFSAEADAAIAPNNLVTRYPNLYPVMTSQEFPGVTLSASPDVAADTRRALIDAMTALHDNADHHAALFELDIDRFVEADPEQYQGLESWLSSIFAF